ncbi:MAG TPA: ferrochelatase [Xanthomonadaceae bacterium]|nr:ferrochelatase [Xanthomonadaceae bacterium]
MPATYIGHPDYRHQTRERCAVLLVNLGTPAAPTARAVRRYLGQFLADPRVIELPRWLWLPALYGAILPLRAPRTAHAYRQVWTEAGSPLLVGTRALARGLNARMGGAGTLTVAAAMRYGEPSIRNVLRTLNADGGLRRLLVLPLYPQYSATTTASVYDAVTAELAHWRWLPELRLVADYHAEPVWLDAVAASIAEHRRTHGDGEKLLFSFHGLPERYVRAGDPYFCQCQHDAREIAQRLGLDSGQWAIAFQSRVGREPWLQPYTDQWLGEQARAGVRRIDVVCPGFAVDCLETLEEIALRNAQDFVAAGGEALRYIPCLNDSPAHLDVLEALLRRHCHGWPELEGETDPGRWQRRAERRSAFDAWAEPDA